MNCPKCGYVQDERPDCIRCGIVFSKYYALHLPEKPARAEPSEPYRPPAAPVPEETQDLTGLRQTIQELNRRVRDVEFERAERNQLRGEIRSLDQRIQDLNSQIGTRLSEIEARVSELPETASSVPIDVLKEQLWQEDLEPVLEKIEQFETSIEKLQKQESPKPDARVIDGIRRLESRIADVEGRFAGLLSEHETPEKHQGAGIEEVQKDIADLRVSVQNATIRYSEIGDLKKNDLVLLSHVESIRRDVETLKKQPSNGTAARFAELQADISALHAEVRQNWKRLEALESGPSSYTAEVGALKDDMAGFKKSRIEEAQKIQLALAASSDRVLALTQQIQGLAGDVQRVNQTISTVQAELLTFSARLGTSDQKISALEATADLPRPPLEEDVHAIRDNLDEIRRFVSQLQKV